MKTDHEKKRDRLINNIKRSSAELLRMGYKIKIDPEVEGLAGQVNDHVYIYDTMINRIIFQKLLFSILKKQQQT